MVKKAKVSKKTTKKTLVSTSKKESGYDNSVLLSRLGEEEGQLLITMSEVVFCFHRNHNPMISLETMEKWVKQAKNYAKSIKSSKKVTTKKVKSKVASKKKKV